MNFRFDLRGFAERINNRAADRALRSAAAQNSFERKSAAVEQTAAQLTGGRQAQAVAVFAERSAHRRDKPKPSGRAAEAEDFRRTFHPIAGLQRFELTEACADAIFGHIIG